MDSLSQTMGLTEGVTTFIGAGGKTSTIYHLAKELSSQGKRVIITTTTKMFFPTQEEAAIVLLEPTAQQILEAFQKTCIIAIASDIKQGKILGLSDTKITELVAFADYVLVEGDGARRMALKVPAAHEPVIPSSTQKVVILLGLSAVGKSLEESCFRSEKAAGLLETTKTHIVTPEDLLQLLIKEDGLQKGIDGKEQMVLCNQVDCQGTCIAYDDVPLTKTIKKWSSQYKHKIIVAALQHNWWKSVD